MRLWLTLATVLAWSASLAFPAAGAEFDRFGIEAVSASLSDHRAGAHPDFVSRIVMAQDPAAEGRQPYADLKDVRVELPPGLLANLNAVEACGLTTFILSFSDDGRTCPWGSQVGLAAVRVPGEVQQSLSSLYRLDGAGSGAVARFGFYVANFPVFIDVRLRSGGDYGATAEVRDISSVAPIREVETELWGVPADPSHDEMRITPLESAAGKTESPPRPAEHPPAAFLSNPTRCGVPLELGADADSEQEPGRFVHAATSLGEITGCGGLDFRPSLSLEATTRAAAAPSGAEAVLTIPQHEGYEEPVASQLRDAVIRLPLGVAISPGAAEGLAACSEEQVGDSGWPPPPARCPEAAKIATAEIDSPALERPIQGAVYQRTPAPGSPFRAWLVADELGVHLKLPGEFELDPLTGQITSLFLETPQLPVRSLRLRFKEGSRGILATPRRCGVYESTYSLTPWSGAPAVAGSSPMSFDQACETGGFSPRLRSGALDPAAGRFSPVYVQLSQASGEQNLARIQVTMPPGLLAKLRGVEPCPEQDAAAASCPIGSLVGHVVAAAGFGQDPLRLPQPGGSPTAVYLAGPYRGAPYSLIVAVPAQAGPFDLGDVVVRAALEVDESTAQVTAASDPLPQIVAGVPVSYRDLRVELDRPRFTLDPTSCDPTAVSGQARGIEGAVAGLAARFQLSGCRSLSFKPRLRLALAGDTKRAGDPSLSATLRMPGGGANVAWARVALPPGLQIDNRHVDRPCTRTEFATRTCPPSSILGRAEARSPLLGEPLAGPVYFRSNGGARALPDIVADLRGPIHIALVGFVDSERHRIRTTFAAVPDAPVRSFRIRLYGGRRGLLQNNRDICRSAQRAVVQFNGQNGKIADSVRRVRVGCRRHRHRP